MALAEDRTLTRPLKVLVPLIREELESAEEAGLEHYQRAGEMLLEAREQVTSGTWRAWLKTNFTLSHTTADRYMKLARLDAVDVRQRPTLSDAVDRRGTHHQVAWHRPVTKTTDTIDWERLRQDRQAESRERRLQQEVGIKLIDLGYKILATKLHPDKGGSAEAMARLNKVRLRLKGAL